MYVYWHKVEYFSGLHQNIFLTQPKKYPQYLKGKNRTYITGHIKPLVHNVLASYGIALITLKRKLRYWWTKNHKGKTTRLIKVY